MMRQTKQYTTKRFYFSDQQGNVITDDLLIADAQLVIRELARRGFRFTYAMWL